MFGPGDFFAQPVVSMMGFGIAIDYGLFVVSRFREEIAEGYDTEAAVRRTVMTAGRTVVFSAVADRRVGGQPLLVAAGLREVADLRGDHLGDAGRGAVDHAAAGLPGDPGQARRRARRAHPVPGAVPGELDAVARLPELAGRPAAEDQDPRRGRGRILGQAGQRRHAAAAGLRHPHHHRDDRADHSAAQPLLAAGSARSTCRRTTRCAWRRRTSTNCSPATARTS